MDGKRNYIYLFYERVAADSDGSSLPDAKYYKCWHGPRKTFKLTKAMRYSLTSTSHFDYNYNFIYYRLTSIFRHDWPSVIEVSSDA